MVLFGEDGGGFGRGYLADFLWALESLAWSPDLLSRVTSILAKLASLDPNPKSKFQNRPANSLRQIFLCLRPYL